MSYSHQGRNTHLPVPILQVFKTAAHFNHDFTSAVAFDHANTTPSVLCALYVPLYWLSDCHIHYLDVPRCLRVNKAAGK